MDAELEERVQPDAEPQLEEVRERRWAKDEVNKRPNELRVINTSESPLGRIKRQLQEIKGKADASSSMSFRIAFNNDG